MHVTHPAQDVAIVVYKADLQGRYKGKDVSGTYNCSGVWMNKGGKWLCPLHTEVKMERRNRTEGRRNAQLPTANAEWQTQRPELATASG